MPKERMKDELKKYFAEIGKRGGKVRTPQKIEAVKRNLQIARLKRLKKEKEKDDDKWICEECAKKQQ